MDGVCFVLPHAGLVVGCRCDLSTVVSDGDGHLMLDDGSVVARETSSFELLDDPIASRSPDPSGLEGLAGGGPLMSVDLAEELELLLVQPGLVLRLSQCHLLISLSVMGGNQNGYQE